MSVAVLGAGLAGLTAARVLERAGVPVTLYEARPQVSGLAQTYDEEGFIFDFGPHFITNRFAARIGIRGKCERVRYGESVWLHGKHLGFPFGVGSRPRYALSLLAGRLARRNGHRSSRTSEQLRRHYGNKLTEDLLVPMLEKWGGEPLENLSPDTLTRIPPARFGLLVKKLTGHLAALSMDYMARDPRVFHVYPREGLRAVFDALLDGLGACLRFNCPVEKILVEGRRVTGVRAGGENAAHDAVVYTLPANLLPRFVPEAEQVRGFGRLKYRPLVVANLKFKRDTVLPDLIVWYPQPEVPFFRTSEPSLAADFFAPPGHTLVCVELGCSLGDGVWEAPDEEIVDQSLDWLGRLYGARREEMTGWRVLRTAYGYPIYQLDTDTQRRQLQAGVFAGFHPCGRNGAFKFQLMEDVYDDACRCGEAVVSYLRNTGR